MGSSIERKTARGVIYKLIERISVQLVSLIISIILARMLLPEAYGEIAMVNIFIEICNVFVNYGFGTAIIHKQDASEQDIATCFWACVLLSIILYGIIFLCAPLIATYYEMPSLKSVIRFMGMQIFLTSINSVQIALVSKKFKYKLLMIVTLLSTIISGIVGVLMAYAGYGVWALGMQSMLNLLILTGLLAVFLKWVPRWTFSFSSLKEQFLYSWKLLIVGMVDCVYAESRNLIIAKRYSSNDLAFYNKGSQFPKLISNTVNQSIIAVLFPSMSILQDDKAKIRQMVRNSLSILTFALFPVLMGLAAVASSFVEILLTSKWLECVPYLQILCIAYMIAPMQSVYKQSFKALNRNKTLLVVNLIEKTIGIMLLIFVFKKGVLVIAWSFVLYHLIGLVFYMVASRKMIEYKISTQIKDIFINFFPAFIMFIVVVVLGKLPYNLYITLSVQIFVGVLTYLLVSLALKNRSAQALISIIRQHFMRNR